MGRYVTQTSGGDSAHCAGSAWAAGGTNCRRLIAKIRRSDVEFNVPSNPVPTVLYVDDEPLSQKYFASAIAPFASVITASNAIEARKILEANPSTISVVVSDERMPIETGVPFLADVRKSWPGVRRVLTSAYADLENLRLAINDAAICQFVPKPWDTDQLCAAVREALTMPATLDNGFSVPLAENMLVSELALSFEGPLQAMQQDSLRIMSMSGSGRAPIAPATSTTGQVYATQRALGQIASTAARLHQTATVCREFASALVAVTSKNRKLH